MLCATYWQAAVAGLAVPVTRDVYKRQLQKIQKVQNRFPKKIRQH